MKASTISLTTTAIATALIAILAQVSIPIGPVPFSLLTIGVGLMASLLKPQEATLAGLLYLTLGAIGLPVFAQFSGGLHVLIGTSGGYLWGILPYMIVTSHLLKARPKPASQTFMANLLGDSLLFIAGFIGLQYFGKLDANTAFKFGVLPFILPDLLKLAIISFLRRPLLQSLSGLNYFKTNN